MIRRLQIQECITKKKEGKRPALFDITGKNRLPYNWIDKS